MTFDNSVQTLYFERNPCFRLVDQQPLNDCSASTLWFTEVPESNMLAACRLKLQLQQQVVVGDNFSKWTAADRQSSRRTSEGKPADIFFCKIWPGLLKKLFYGTYKHAFSSFGVFSKLRVAVKVTYCCFKARLLLMKEDGTQPFFYKCKNSIHKQ